MRSLAACKRRYAHMTCVHLANVRPMPLGNERHVQRYAETRERVLLNRVLQRVQQSSKVRLDAARRLLQSVVGVGQMPQRATP